MFASSAPCTICPTVVVGTLSIPVSAQGRSLTA